MWIFIGFIVNLVCKFNLYLYQLSYLFAFCNNSCKVCEKNLGPLKEKSKLWPPISWSEYDQICCVAYHTWQTNVMQKLYALKRGTCNYAITFVNKQMVRHAGLLGCMTCCCVFRSTNGSSRTSRSLKSVCSICDPVWENCFYRLLKVSRNAGFKYLVCCSSPMVEAMCIKFSHVPYLPLCK